MRYIAVATDYDGTLAKDGSVAPATVSALEKVKASGRTLILVTGRHLDDLAKVFPQLQVFDRVVVENGAVLYDPKSREEKLLTDPPAENLISALWERGVPFDVGRAILSSWVPHQNEILEVIHALALNHQIVFNKGAVMVLPPGVNKATGLAAALKDLKLSSHNCVSMGDAENDHTFLSASELGVAVANAVPALQERADVILPKSNGEGVAELLRELLEDDLTRYDDRNRRHSIVLGTRPEGTQTDGSVCLSPNRNSILVAGESASGKSSLVAGVLEQLAESKYQFCLVDPEGDYENFADALSLGSANERPDPSTIVRGLENPDQSIIVNLLGIPVRERPDFFSALLPKILELRARVARPHWLVIDEAHHLMPESWSPASSTVPQTLGGTILVTVHPDHVSSAALSLVDLVVATGAGASKVLTEFARIRQLDLPAGTPSPNLGEGLVWFAKRSSYPLLVKFLVAKGERRRHKRNYAEGELSEAQSFFFRGPDSKMNLRAHNLHIFLQIADGVDDETWQFHRMRGDYSNWMDAVVKDPDLASEVRSVERNSQAGAMDSRKQIREVVERRYTPPA